MSQPQTSPQLPPLLTLAAHHLRANRPADAIPPLQSAARLAPARADISHDLGLACLATGRIPEAVAALTQSIQADPRYADAHLRLGIAHEAAGAPDRALKCYGRAAQLHPALADAHYRAADLLESFGRPRHAADAFQRAAATAPNTTLARIATAKSHILANNPSEAEASLRQALAHEPGNAAALELLGTLLAETGQFEAARETLLQAIARAPLRAGSYYEVARCRRLTEQDAPLIAQMNQALATPGLEPAQRARVHLALGKAADDRADYETAMRHFDAAEALRNTLHRFSLPDFVARIDRLIAAFPPPLPAAAPPQTPTPIFIFGLPRSGTTLVEQILSAHPNVHGAGELPFWNDRGHAWDTTGAPPAASFLAAAASDYRLLLAHTAPGAAYVTDKMPLNFLWAGLIHLAMPGAILIHCKRAAIDTALSIHQTHINPRMPFPTGGEALVGYIRAYQRLSAHWRNILPPRSFIELQYETLVQSPELQVRRLLAHCGLQWDDACLQPERNPRAVRTPSKWQARQPIHPHAVGKWQFYEPWLGTLGQLIEEERKDVLF